jgi:hypothetical protein
MLGTVEDEIKSYPTESFETWFTSKNKFWKTKKKVESPVDNLMRMAIGLNLDDGSHYSFTPK